jgi:hypothetical protein
MVDVKKQIGLLNTQVRETRYLNAARKAGEGRLISTFGRSTFVYGTRGTGHAVLPVLADFLATVRTNLALGRRPNPQIDPPGQEALRQQYKQQVNLFDPGSRTVAVFQG